jgi:hypothetical protein
MDVDLGEEEMAKVPYKKKKLLVEMEPKVDMQTRVNLTECQSLIFDNQSENAIEDEEGGPSGRTLGINNTSNIKTKKTSQPSET